MTDRPLVTFALFAFNQEAYIRDAVKGTLAQTYSPLQIILSDDCSSDRTFEIMREEAQRYSGQHMVEVNRNLTNLGFVEHLGVVMEKCRGEFIVVAAGDDISFPQRTGKLVDTWDREGRKVMSIFSGYKMIDAAGNFVGAKKFFDGYHWATPAMRIGGGIPVEGATHAFNKRLYDDFGPLVENAINEDVILQFRASLRGGVFVISDQLVSYRKHFESLSAFSVPVTSSTEVGALRQVELVNLDRYRRCLKNFVKDIGIATRHGWVSADDAENLIELTNKKLKSTAVRQSFLSETNPSVLSALIVLAKSGASMPIVARDILLRHFPSFFIQIRSGKNRIRRLTKSA